MVKKQPTTNRSNQRTLVICLAVIVTLVVLASVVYALYTVNHGAHTPSQAATQDMPDSSMNMPAKSTHDANDKEATLSMATHYATAMHMLQPAIHDLLTLEWGGHFTEAQADYAIVHLNDNVLNEN